MKEQDITEILLEQPRVVYVNDTMLNIYQPSLGATHLFSQAVQSLEIDNVMDVTIKALELSCTKSFQVSRVIAIRTLKTKEELLGKPLIDAIEKINNLPPEDKATLLIMCLADNVNIDNVKKQLKIDKEQKYLAQAIKAKDDKSSYSFGGVSIYGTLIYQAAEKFGWTYDYIMWGISLANLQLILADAPQTVFLNDKERKKVHIPRDRRNTIKADDPRNFEKVEAIIKKQS